MKVPLVCSHCGVAFEREAGHVNRQRRRVGAHVPFFCSQQCTGARRRLFKTKAQKVAEKAAYDRVHRAKNLDRIKAAKREYFKRTYNPETARVKRLERAAWQREYGAAYRATPEWQQHKREYDKQLRAAEYGDFAECHQLLIALEKTVRVQPWYERARERGYYENGRTTTQRKRDAQVNAR